MRHGPSVCPAAQRPGPQEQEEYRFDTARDARKRQGIDRDQRPDFDGCDLQCQYTSKEE